MNTLVHPTESNSAPAVPCSLHTVQYHKQYPNKRAPPPMSVAQRSTAAASASLIRPTGIDPGPYSWSANTQRTNIFRAQESVLQSSTSLAHLATSRGRNSDLHFSTGFDRRGSGVAEEGYSNPDTDFEELGYDSEEDGKPDTINEFTLSEMKTVLQRSSDCKISGREWVEVEILML